MGSHFTSCNHTLEINDISKLVSCARSVVRLMTSEALWISSIKPSLNIKDEYRSRTLVIKVGIICLLIRLVL